MKPKFILKIDSIIAEYVPRWSGFVHYQVSYLHEKEHILPHANFSFGLIKNKKLGNYFIIKKKYTKDLEKRGYFEN